MIWISVFHLKNNKERNTQCEVEEDVGVDSWLILAVDSPGKAKTSVVILAV